MPPNQRTRPIKKKAKIRASDMAIYSHIRLCLLKICLICKGKCLKIGYPAFKMSGYIVPKTVSFA